VSLHRVPDGRIELVIDDDGSGFDPSAPSAGMGLANLRDRIATMNGTLEIESVAGDGTMVRALLPP
jgi:signal transduction histidine kinase